MTDVTKKSHTNMSKTIRKPTHPTSMKKLAETKHNLETQDRHIKLQYTLISTS